MTYRFSGVIGFSDRLDFADLGRRIGGATIKVSAPFKGIAHAFAADYNAHDLSNWETAELTQWSAAHPGDHVLYLKVECFGGVCDHAGVVLNGGVILEHVDFEDGRAPHAALQRLFAAAGQSASTMAMPFLERGAFTFDDDAHMRRAFALARSQFGRTGDNPSVGCVIVSDRGRVLAEAATADDGRPHAEEHALALLSGDAAGATAYVTLEPCRERSSGDHSCAERLISAGVRRVVYGCEDLHPQGAGGLDRLQNAGVDISQLNYDDAAEALYADFFRRAAQTGP